MPLIPYPNVPAGAPGVPTVPVNPIGSQYSILSAGIQVAGAAVSVLRSFGLLLPNWGVYNSDGSQALIPDSIRSFDYDDGSRISDYPVEKGAFQSFNKVANPYAARFEMVIATGGVLGQFTAPITGTSARSNFMSKLAALKDSLTLVSVVTPEVTYTNANLSRYTYRRQARNGMTLIIIDATFEQIRQGVVSAGLTNTSDPSGMDRVSNGQVSASPAPVLNQSDFSVFSKGV